MAHTVSMESPRITLAAAMGVNARRSAATNGTVASEAGGQGRAEPEQAAERTEAAAQQVGEDEAPSSRVNRSLASGTWVSSHQGHRCRAGNGTRVPPASRPAPAASRNQGLTVHWKAAAA